VKATILSGAIGLAFTVASFPAAAEWLKVAQTSTATFYVDSTSVVKANAKVKVWRLIDLNGPSQASSAPNDHLSSIGQSEYDCALHQYRNGYTADYAGAMGSGLPLRSIIGSRAWAPVTPGSTDELMLAFACGKP
jgi:hypothetical protein